jgi:hypothetical protein
VFDIQQAKNLLWKEKSAVDMLQQHEQRPGIKLPKLTNSLDK